MTALNTGNTFSLSFANNFLYVGFFLPSSIIWKKKTEFIN